MLKLNSLKHAFFLLFFLFASSIVYGQVNIEAQRKTNDLNGFFNKIRLTGNVASGNSEYVSVSGRWESNWVHNQFQTFLVSDGEYKSGDSKRLVNKAFAHLREVYAVNDLTSIELFEQVAYNEFIKLQIRGLGGGGLRLNFFHDTTGWQKKIKLALGVGAMYEYEKYSDISNTSKKCLRSTDYVSISWDINSGAKFDMTAYYQPDLLNFTDYRILIDANLKFIIGKHVTFVFNVDYRHDNTPVQDVVPYDLAIKNGIEITF
jgi:hypothetical protein